jgi:hypothetical protein
MQNRHANENGNDEIREAIRWTQHTNMERGFDENVNYGKFQTLRLRKHNITTSS